jgi:hypothetical protein
MTDSIINSICNTCSCNDEQAKEYLDDEVRNLRDLQELGDLRSSDIEVACDNLGVEYDYIEYFVNALCF